jgi:hypothetical protein
MTMVETRTALNDALVRHERIEIENGWNMRVEAKVNKSLAAGVEGQ